MTNQNEAKKVTIDATGRAIGRVASEVALILRGKDRANFRPYLAPSTQVEIVNAGKLLVTPLKLTGKTYARYSGYPGGLKRPSLRELVDKHGFSEPLRHAIRGMLPRNKLRAKLMNHLRISE